MMKYVHSLYWLVIAWGFKPCRFWDLEALSRAAMHTEHTACLLLLPWDLVGWNH